jgi:hypothetical protein
MSDLDFISAVTRYSEASRTHETARKNVSAVNTDHGGSLVANNDTLDAKGDMPQNPGSDTGTPQQNTGNASLRQAPADFNGVFLDVTV